MKKYLICCLTIAFLAIAAVALVFSGRPANAQVGKGLNGSHYNLNIIGVPKGKSADMTNSDGHTIFVPLDGTARINYLAGDQFQVLDRNGTDAGGHGRGEGQAGRRHWIHGILKFDVQTRCQRV